MQTRRTMSKAIELSENGYLPEWLMRFGMRRLLKKRLEKETDEYQEVSVVKISDINPKEVKLEGDDALITLEITSHQDVVNKDKDGNVIESDEHEDLDEVQDIWTFSKDMKSEDPNWLLVQIHPANASNAGGTKSK